MKVLEVSEVPIHLGAREACGVVWHCTDMLPGMAFDQMQEDRRAVRAPLRLCTYAAAARVVKAMLAARAGSGA